MRLEPLSKKTLEEARKLVNRIFPIQDDYEKSDYCFPASLSKAYEKSSPYPGVVWIKYWVAVERGGVIGTVGLYEMKDDAREAYWLGYICVEPAYRKEGIGKKLLEFAIKKSRDNGKQFLRLYTSDDPNEADAQKLYEKLGFAITRRNVRLRGGKWNVFYRELKL